MRCVAPQLRKAATQNSRPARTASASMLSVCVVMGERVQSGAAPGDRNRLPQAVPAISAAALSHWQPTLTSPSGRPITVFEGTGTQAFFPRGGGHGPSLHARNAGSQRYGYLRCRPTVHGLGWALSADSVGGTHASWATSASRLAPFARSRAAIRAAMVAAASLSHGTTGWAGHNHGLLCWH